MPHAISSELSQFDASRLHTLSNKVTGIKNQLLQIFNMLQASTGPLKTPAGEPAAATSYPSASDPSAKTPISVEAYKTGVLYFTLPMPSATAIADTLATRQEYSEVGKLNKFQRPTSVDPFPDKKFIPEPEVLFG